jgi:tetratricopeptide (TPR) repeat protein
MKKQRKRLMNLQNIKNHREPPRGLVQSIIDTFTKGQKKEAIIQLDALIKDYPLVPLLFNVSGSFYKSNNQLDVAVTKFNQALALKPNYTEVHYNLGVTLRELGLIEKAIRMPLILKMNIQMRIIILAMLF